MLLLVAETSVGHSEDVDQPSGIEVETGDELPHPVLPCGRTRPNRRGQPVYTDMS